MCPSCKKVKLRKKVKLTVDCPIHTNALDKAAIRKKGVVIESVNWGASYLYCPFCGWYEGRPINE